MKIYTFLIFTVHTFSIPVTYYSSTLFFLFMTMHSYILNVPYFTFTVKLFQIIIAKVVDLAGWERKVSQVFSNSYGLSHSQCSILHIYCEIV
jgi:hypothetical protein